MRQGGRDGKTERRKDGVTERWRGRETEGRTDREAGGTLRIWSKPEICMREYELVVSTQLLLVYFLFFLTP